MRSHALAPLLRLHFIFACLLGAAPALGAPGGVDYVVTIAGQTRGEMRVEVAPTERRIGLRFADRGRGPDTRTRLRVDAQGRPTLLEVDGENYFKTRVAERFGRDATQAHWTSAADRGSGDADHFYVAHESSPELNAALVRALLRAPERSLPLLPAGRAHVERSLSRTLRGDAGEVAATLYLIEGVGFAPAPIWLDDRLELVFEGSVWLAVARKDLAAAASELVAAQDQVLRERQEARARSLARRPDAPVAFRGVRLYDAAARTFADAMTVVVRDRHIAAVGPAATVAIPDGAQIVDGQGGTLLPGLIDMHVHIAADSDGLIDIAAGVTSVRDLGNDLDTLRARREAFASGRLIGPRIFMAGLVDGPGPQAGPTRLLISTPEEARQAVAALADAGIPQIKLYSSLKPELVPVIAAAAHARGLRVSGHVPAGMTLEDVVRAGYDEVQHANFWMLNFMGPAVAAEIHGLGRFTHTGQRGVDLDLDSAEVRAFVALLREHRTVLDPTLAAMEDVLTGTAGQPPASLAAVADRLPPQILRAVSATGFAKDPAQRERYAQSAQRMRQMLRRLHAAGVPIVAGTDGYAASLSLVHELERYAAAGLSPADALYTATLGAARVLGEDARIGSIQIGKLADLILVDGDPARDLGTLRRTRLVMKDGVSYAPDALFAAAGVAPAPRR
ncbi:MAG: amidohydrolase family protein [Dokdonella sp.]|nr:amidohydrolase family protein [Dokdonella sp.]